MLKATGSKKGLEEIEFFNFISDIISLEQIQQLKNYTHHISTTRFQHSLNVSYYNYLICKKLHFNACSAARAGLLHDLYYYRTKDYIHIKGEKRHIRSHPETALKNASELFELNNVEKDIILKHMWPFTIAVPRYKESFVIVFVDKYCAVMELLSPYIKLLKRKKIK